MWRLDYFIKDPVFLNVIFGFDGLLIGKLSDVDDNNFSIPANNQNLPCRKLLDKLNNVTSIKIKYVQIGLDDKYYSFCLFRLLSLIENTKIEKIEILGCVKEEGLVSWLSSSWKVWSSSLIQTYKNKGFKIEYKEQRSKHYIYINKTRLIFHGCFSSTFLCKYGYLSHNLLLNSYCIRRRSNN